MKSLRNLSILIISFFILFSCNNENQALNNEKLKTTYDKVLEAKEIKVGYISYPPSFIKDPNTGKYSGIFYEVLSEIGKQLNLKINYTEELSWGTMTEAIQSGRVDMVCTGIWPTIGRGKIADFTIPLYYSTVRAYTQIGNTKFDGDLLAINNSDIKIAAIDGEMTSLIAKADYPKAIQISLPQMSDVSLVLLDVGDKKADITFAEPAVALEFMNKNPGKIKEVENVNPVRVFPNVMMLGKGDVELASTINNSIRVLINNGFVDAIITKYEKYPNSFQKVALPYRSKY